MRILFVSANPKWEDRLELGDELRTLLGSLKGRDVDLMLLPAAQPEDLRIALASSNIDIVHFSGHAEEEGILLRDADGYAKQMPGSELRELLQDNGVKLAVLNACATKATADEILDTVDTVIGTTAVVDDRAANKLTKVLYSSLASGQAVKAAFGEAVDTIQKAQLPNVYVRDGKEPPEPLFEGASDGTGEINIEGQAPFDKFFYIGYLDEQIRNLTGRIRLNRVMFWFLFLAGLYIWYRLWFTAPIEITEIREYVKSPENWSTIFGTPLLDSLIALGAGIPALISFFQSRLMIHGNRELRSLKQLRELTRASGDLTPGIQGQLQKVLDQCMNSADRDYQPTLDWYRISEKIIAFFARLREGKEHSVRSAPTTESAK